MTNREIRKYEDDRVLILKELKMEKNESWEQHLTKLGDGIKKLQRLADTIGACKYLGSELRNIDEMLTCAEEERFSGAGHSDAIVACRNKCAAYEAICSEINNNIVYKLQTEMMFNACVAAKWSCICAAIAAIAACIGIGLTWCLK